ncbi:hypothetical protein J6590_065791 [Homalodisca vitripennis]|nr:hypothetical protein J6590_065791 [Homalodisca vitripennis]
MNDKSRMHSNANSSDGPASREARNLNLTPADLFVRYGRIDYFLLLFASAIVPRHVRRLTGCGMNDKSRMHSNANSSDGPASREARSQSTQSYHDDKTYCALRS